MRTFFPWMFALPTLSARAALTAFLTLDTSTQARIVQAIREIGYPFRSKRITEKAGQLHQELKVLDVEMLSNIIDAVTDLVAIPADTLSDILAETFKETATPYSSLESAVHEISSDSGLSEQRAIEEFKHLALPALGHIEHFCAIRARFDKQFRYSEDNIESYDPRVIDHHAVVVLKAELQGSSKSLMFQMDQERLDKLISQLIAAQRQLKILVDRGAGAKEIKTDGK